MNIVQSYYGTRSISDKQAKLNTIITNSTSCKYIGIQFNVATKKPVTSTLMCVAVHMIANNADRVNEMLINGF